MTEITNGVTTVHPILWMEYASTRQANTRTHPLMSGGTAVTLAPHGPRTVTLALLFDDEEESIVCEDMHARPSVFTITEAGRPTHSMQYVAVGRVSRELDQETAAVWIVSVEVQEVSE